MALEPNQSWNRFEDVNLRGCLALPVGASALAPVRCADLFLKVNSEYSIRTENRNEKQVIQLGLYLFATRCFTRFLNEFVSVTCCADCGAELLCV